MDWRSLLHPSARAQLSSAANCARCKYRLTPQEANGRSNRRRFSDEQKRAMVQEKEKPGVAGGGCSRPHGIATTRLFRWRVQSLGGICPPGSIPHEDAVHCLDWHRHVNTAHLHGFKDDFPSYVVSAFLYLPRIRLLVRACLIVGHSMSWQSFDRGS